MPIYILSAFFVYFFFNFYVKSEQYFAKKFDKYLKNSLESVNQALL